MRGRQKGQTKRMSKIKDPVIAPYEIWVEEDQYVLVDTAKDKPVGYYTDFIRSNNWVFNFAHSFCLTFLSSTHNLIVFLFSY